MMDLYWNLQKTCAALWTCATKNVAWAVAELWACARKNLCCKKMCDEPLLHCEHVLKKTCAAKNVPWAATALWRCAEQNLCCKKMCHEPLLHCEHVLNKTCAPKKCAMSHCCIVNMCYKKNFAAKKVAWEAATRHRTQDLKQLLEAKCQSAA